MINTVLTIDQVISEAKCGFMTDDLFNKLSYLLHFKETRKSAIEAFSTIHDCRAVKALSEAVCFNHDDTDLICENIKIIWNNMGSFDRLESIRSILLAKKFVHNKILKMALIELSKISFLLALGSPDDKWRKNILLKFFFVPPTMEAAKEALIECRYMDLLPRLFKIARSKNHVQAAAALEIIQKYRTSE